MRQKIQSAYLRLVLSDAPVPRAWLKPTGIRAPCSEPKALGPPEHLCVNPLHVDSHTHGLKASSREESDLPAVNLNLELVANVHFNGKSVIFPTNGVGETANLYRKIVCTLTP
jgi:hypothetical protein